MRTVTDLPYREPVSGAPPGRWAADLHLPGAASGDALVWLHGGGLTSGDKNDHLIAPPLCAKGIAVITAGYRLLQEAAWPACIEDAAAAVAWARGGLAAQGFACRRLFLGGVSAGAYLAAMVALDARWLGALGLDTASLAGVIPLSGQMSSHFAYRKAIGHPEERPLIDAAAPLWHVRADAPRMLLIAGSDDMPCRPEENHYLAAALRSVGHRDVACHVIPDRTHGTIGAGLGDPDDPVTRLIHAFLQR